MGLYDLVGDESFAVGNLPPTAQTWHARVMAEDITSSPYTICAVVEAAGDDLLGVETLGENMRFNIMPLVFAFRYTGDLAILDIIDTVMEYAVTPLITNGYIYDVDHMGQAGLSATLQQMAWIYTLNSGKTSPGEVDYAARATQWIDYLTNVYEPQWLPFAANYNLRHRSSATLLSQYYHWRRTSTAASWYEENGWSGLWDEGYIAYRDYHFAENRQDLNPASVSAIGQQLVYDAVVGWRYIIDHGCLYPWQPTVPAYGWQATNYATYTLCNHADLAVEGIYPFGVTNMTRYANTAAWVMQDAGEAGLIRDSVNDATFVKNFETHDLQTNRWGVIPYLGRWNADLLQWGDVGWALASKKICLAAWMLAATV